MGKTDTPVIRCSAMSDLAIADAVGTAELITSGEVTPLDVVDAAIDRIELGNPLLNAVITPLFASARAAASRPVVGGALSGGPFLMKDALCHTK